MKLKLETVSWQLIVHRGTPFNMLGSIREFAADNGYEVVDARWRRSDRLLMMFAATMFVASGAWLLLLVALWAGWDWARSYPRMWS